jgi:DNA-binding XRE family transcriptional regulator
MAKKVKKFLALRYLRTRFGLTQGFLGLKIGVSDTGYSMRENGYTPWQLPECFIIQSIINKKLEETEEEAMTLDKIFIAHEVSKKTRNKQLKQTKQSDSIAV